MKTSFIVPCYHITDELFQLSRAMFLSLDETTGNHEIEKIIIDNHSLYGNDYLRQESDIYIYNTENVGYCRGINQGLQLATGDLFAISNNDIRVSPNWLSVAIEILNQYPKVGAVYFKMVGYDEEFNLGNDVWVTGKERWCHGSMYVLRREALPEGLYFEGYGIGGYDDYDFFHRMRDINGWQQAYTNRAAFQHKDSSTQLAVDAVNHKRQESDIHNRELYKERFGEYPDVQFANLFPEQMQIPWKPFP